jgi:hypothetical protein
MKYNRKVAHLILAGVIAFVVSACTSGPSGSDPGAAAKARNDKLTKNELYTPKNNIEFDNYNKRLKVSDNPTTILWCTAYPTNPNARPITVPIVGKLTSSSKRPYATSHVLIDTDTGSKWYNPEIPGPDAMYGESVPYRYGFTPAGDYWDFTFLESACTTVPTVYQAQATTIVNKVDPAMQAANLAAQAALKAGHPDQASKILDDAIAKVGNK